MSQVAVAFEGRSAELEHLLGRLSEVLSGRGTMVAISGEAGIGKTRLMEEFKKIGDRTGCMVMTGKCISGPPSPYLPFRDMLPRKFLVDSYWEGARENRPNKGDRFPFHILDLIKEIENERPLMIILEDMHWADEDSVALLHFLGKKVASLRVMVICTYRPKEILATGFNGTHPLYATLMDMRKEGICEDLVLGPLGRTDLGNMAAGILDHPLEGSSLDRLIECTGPNTLYFIETLLAMEAGGALELEKGSWRMTPGTKVPVNDPVRQAVLGQVDLLNRPERRVLELASVMGVSFDYSVVANVLEQEGAKVSQLLDGIETRTDLIRDTGDGYCFSDTLTRDVIRGQISPMRQKEFLKAVEKIKGNGSMQ